MRRGIRGEQRSGAARNHSVERPLLTTCTVVECLGGLALLLAPGRTSALLLGRPPGLVGPMIGRVTGVALVALGIACWGARTDSGGAARAGTLMAVTTYNAGAAVLLVRLGATGKARGRVVWGAGLLHLCLAGALAASRSGTLTPRRPTGRLA